MRKPLRYDLYGALVGVGLPLFATFIEAIRRFGSVAPDALARAHLGQPLLWIMDTTPVVLGGLGFVIVRQARALVRQSDELVRQSEEIVRLEQARRESFSHTATELSHAAQGLLGNVSSFTHTTAQTAESVRQTTATMNELSHAASSAALTAETVIGLALEAEHVAERGLDHAERSHAELIRLADEVRGLATRGNGHEPRAEDAAGLAAIIGEVATRSHANAETIRSLAIAIRGSSRAAREIARVAQQQESEIEQVLKSLNEIHHATEDTVASTQSVADEARTLTELATTLRTATRG
jgi:methyl-accepting chemotaxis protein